MKKQNFTHSILYTKNSLEPVDNKNIQIANPFGSFANMNYDYSIVWVPETRNGDARLLRITPQYKFGCAKSSSDNDWTNATASSSNVSFDVSSNNTEITLLPLASPTNYTDYTDNIVIKLETAINNSTSSININTTLSNYSSILSDLETSIYYNLSFRLKLEIYNQTSETVEDTSYSKYYCVRFGRSIIENVGDSPFLPWDETEEGVLHPLISKRKRRTKVFNGQSSGDGVGGGGVGPPPPSPPSPSPSPGNCTQNNDCSYWIVGGINEGEPGCGSYSTVYFATQADAIAFANSMINSGCGTVVYQPEYGLCCNGSCYPNNLPFGLSITQNLSCP